MYRDFGVNPVNLTKPHRPTMEDHVPRHAQMGAWVLINDRWYHSNPLPGCCYATKALTA